MTLDTVGSGPPASVAETHSAVVFFFGDRAYKVKKALDLGFLDFRSRDARRRACEREVELNRRLASDVYLGVADLHGPDGRVADHLVVMRRMPAERRLATLVTTGVDVDDDLWHLAHLLAAFHAAAERSTAADKAASAHALTQRWSDNTATLAHYAKTGSGVTTLDPDLVQHVHTLGQRYIEGRQALFDLRIAEGRACDGHGDLLADDIFCLEDGPRVLDCIEFDDALRYGDTLADVAFLAMDLERLGQPALADHFLQAYREHAGDTWPASLAHHHIAYRAQVRAKVSALRAAQGDESSAPTAAELLGLAHDHLEAGRIRLILVGGLPGTGKSTLARGLGQDPGTMVLRSDEIRKELASLAPGSRAAEPFGEGIYSPSFNVRTYETLLERAAVALRLGESVILDASWADDAWRSRARGLADDTRADLVELRCDAPADVATRRIETRRAQATGESDTDDRPPGPPPEHDPSDATPEIAARLAELEAPWPSSTRIDTSASPEAALDAALEQLRSCEARDGR